MPKNKIISGVIGVLILAVGIFVGKSLNKKEDIKGVVSTSPSEKIVVYKSPDCGCCVKWISYMKGQGFEVEEINKEDSSSIKNEYSIPNELQSCHTAVVGGYFVEGHVPVEAVNKLLEERPDIDGIGLAGMPSGSPGMPGLKTEKFEIYSLKDGVISDFMAL